MDRDGMPAPRLFTDQIDMIRELRGYEEGGLDAELVQNVQKPRGIRRRPVVKGQIDDLASGVLDCALLRLVDKNLTARFRGVSFLVGDAVAHRIGPDGVDVRKTAHRDGSREIAVHIICRTVAGLRVAGADGKVDFTASRKREHGGVHIFINNLAGYLGVVAAAVRYMIDDPGLGLVTDNGCREVAVDGIDCGVAFFDVGRAGRGVGIVLYKRDHRRRRIDDVDRAGFFALLVQGIRNHIVDRINAGMQGVEGALRDHRGAQIPVLLVCRGKAGLFVFRAGLQRDFLLPEKGDNRNRVRMKNRPGHGGFISGGIADGVDPLVRCLAFRDHDLLCEIAVVVVLSAEAFFNIFAADRIDLVGIRLKLDHRRLRIDKVDQDFLFVTNLFLLGSIADPVIPEDLRIEIAVRLYLRADDEMKNRSPKMRLRLRRFKILSVFNRVFRLSVDRQDHFVTVDDEKHGKSGNDSQKNDDARQKNTRIPPDGSFQLFQFFRHFVSDPPKMISKIFPAQNIVVPGRNLTYYSVIRNKNQDAGAASYRSISSMTGQWSEPMTSGWIEGLNSFVRRSLLIRK